MDAPDNSSDTLAAVSRLLSKVLRHEPQLIGIHLDDNGWTGVGDLLAKFVRSKRSPEAPKRLRTLPEVTRELLLQVVANNDKGRYALSEDGQRIRAVKGHLVEVDLHYKAVEPLPVLFHGTAAENWPSIAKKGLVRGTRHAVHLSGDEATARRVLARHGRPVVLQVAALRMHREGIAFSRADNGVWLVESVPARYLTVLRMDG